MRNLVKIFITILILLALSPPASAQEPGCTPFIPPQQHRLYFPFVTKGAKPIMPDSFWFVVVPETTINLVTNPSFELATTGYSAKGSSTISRSAEAQYRGAYSGKVVPTSGTGDGIQYALTLATTTQYTFSIDVKGVDGIPYSIDIYDNTAGSILGSAVSFTSDGQWARYAVTATTGANTAIRLRIYKNNHASTGAFYVDGLQVEAKAYPTDYCDGDLDGCLWTAGVHQSTSSRLEQFSAAGQVVNMSNYAYVILGIQDAGMPVIEISATQPAQSDGSNFRRQTMRERNMQLPGYFEGTSRRNLHAIRSTFLRLISPDRFATQQPVHLRYVASGKMLDNAFYHRGGLEGNSIGKDFTDGPGSQQWYATDPSWTQVARTFTADDIAAGIGTGGSGTDGSASYNGGGGGGGPGTGNDGMGTLTAQQSVSNCNYIVQQDSSGQWAAMGTGLTLPTNTTTNAAPAQAIAISADNLLYVGGGLIFGNYIRYWDGVSWSVPGSGTNGDIEVMVVGPDGALYVGGNFTLAGGVSNTAYIAKWDGSNWSALGTGTNGEVHALAFADNGDLYVAGDFTLAGGVSNTAYIAKWDGSNWSALSTGANGAVRALAFADNGDLYVAGDFTTIGGQSISRVAKWNGSSFTAVGSDAPNGLVHALSIDSTGNLYIGGDFTQVGSVSNTTYIAKWNGSNWSAMGTGANLNVIVVGVDLNDNVYAGGLFTQMSGVSNTAYVARWDGSSWNAMGNGASASVEAMDIAPDGRIVLSGTFVTGVKDSSGSSVTDTQYVAIWNGLEWRSIAQATKAVIRANNRDIYVGGGFSQAGGVSNTSRIAKWNGSAWSALGTGANSVVQAIAEAPNGDIYIAGVFTQVGGVSNTSGVAKWNGSAWSALGTGLNGSGLALAFAPNGDLYIGGLFLDAGGVSNTRNLVKWNGSSFVALSAETNSAVNTLAFASNGDLYIGGSFSKVGATSYNYIARYTPGSGTFAGLSTGLNGYVNALDFAPDGSLYLGGVFSQAGSVSAINIARWNGSAFSALGAGVNGAVYVIEVDQGTNLVYAGGNFTQAGGITLPDKAAAWNGSAWSPIGINLPGNAAVEAMLIRPSITVIGFDTAGTATAEGVN